LKLELNINIVPRRIITDVLAGSALIVLLGEAPLSRIKKRVPYTANLVEYSHR